MSSERGWKAAQSIRSIIVVAPLEVAADLPGRVKRRVHVRVGDAGPHHLDDGGEVAASMPCAVGPITSAATTLPVIVPELEAGHDGFPPPPQKKKRASPPLK